MFGAFNKPRLAEEAHYQGVGWKFGRRVDVGYWQKDLGDG